MTLSRPNLPHQTHPPNGPCECCEPPDCDSEGASCEGDHPNDTEVLYEETDWTNPLTSEPVPEDVQRKLQSSIRQLRTLTGELSRSRVKDDPKGVKRDLVEWLGPQAYKLDREVSLVEMFCGKGNLSEIHAKASNTECIKLGPGWSMDRTLNECGTGDLCFCF